MARWMPWLRGGRFDRWWFFSPPGFVSRETLAVGSGIFP